MAEFPPNWIPRLGRHLPMGTTISVSAGAVVALANIRPRMYAVIPETNLVVELPGMLRGGDDIMHLAMYRCLRWRWNDDNPRQIKFTATLINQDIAIACQRKLLALMLALWRTLQEKKS